MPAIGCQLSYDCETGESIGTWSIEGPAVVQGAATVIVDPRAQVCFDNVKEYEVSIINSTKEISAQSLLPGA